MKERLDDQRSKAQRLWALGIVPAMGNVFTGVPREVNQVADRLANMAMDAKGNLRFRTKAIQFSGKEPLLLVTDAGKTAEDGSAEVGLGIAVFGADTGLMYACLAV